MRAVERILPLLPSVLKGFFHPIKSLQQPIKNNNILYIDNIKILVESYKYTIRNKNLFGHKIKFEKINKDNLATIEFDPLNPVGPNSSIYFWVIGTPQTTKSNSQSKMKN